MLAMNQPMLSIGRFSQLTGLTMRALRLYDELGLLRPDVVDADSRYRYYTTEQIKSATLIGRLRRLDMPLEEVGLFLSGETQVRGTNAGRSSLPPTGAGSVCDLGHEGP